MQNEHNLTTHPRNPLATAERPTQFALHNRPELYEALRKYRRELARAQQVPPYIICTNKSLHDMCAKLPRTEDAMKTIDGLGSKRFESYGKLFLEFIEKELSDGRPLV